MRNSNFPSIFLLSLFILSGSFLGLFAQGVMVANPDNFFVTPNSSTPSLLDVLSNDYYGDDCLKSELVITIVSGHGPSKGYAGVNAATQSVSYFPLPGKSGQDSLTYKIECSKTGNSSTAKAYININNRPGVVSNADCYVEPEGITFDIKMLAESNLSEMVSANDVPLVANLDDDDDIEIVIFANRQTGTTTSGAQVRDGIKIFSYNKQNNNIVFKYKIPYSANDWTLGNIAIAKITAPIGHNLVYPKTRPSVFVYEPRLCALIRYDLEDKGLGILEYQETWRKTTTQTNRYSHPIPFVVDLMGDGHQQIIVADKIYDADTGILLAQATDGTNSVLINHSDVNSQSLSPYSFGIFGHPGAAKTSTRTYAALMVAGDIDNDGILELVGGDCVYKVNITDYSTEYTTSSPNTYRFHKRANTTGHPEVQDGAAALADINNDGLLDVVVTTKNPSSIDGTNGGSLYVYDPRTGELLHQNVITGIPIMAPTHGPSMPFVGDLDGDGYVEMACTGNSTLRAYKLNLLTSQLEEMWRLPTTDTSAATTLSLFDFAQDGKAKLIYRDETDLRILDARKYDDDNNLITDATRVLATFSGIYSGTINEYPIVADVNGDGAAEIITVGTSYKNVANSYGQIKIYAASGTKKWAPARSVWNQIAYNPVYVNDDLTIPSHPVSPATKFVSSDGSVSRPFNNSLQQATLLNREGTMITEGADLTFAPRAPKRISYNDDGSISISVTLTNVGGVSFTGPISLQLYSSHDGPPVSYVPVGSAYVLPNASGLFPNAELVVNFDISASSVPSEGSYDGFAITVNLDTDPGDNSPVYKHGVECHEGYNNRSLGFNVLTGSAVICEGESGVVHVSPSGVYDIDWYDTGGNLLANATDVYTLPLKNSDAVTYLLVQAFRPGNSTPVSALMDTVYVYRSSDSLVWTNGRNNGDWHDPGNWFNPSDASGVYSEANVPRGCTNVYLPSGLSSYPDLGDLSSGGSTDYRQSVFPSCHNVHFGFGSEVKRPDLLVYDSAFVDVSLESHRWYMFSPPLKDFYAGDFYKNSAIPIYDDLKSYTRLWGGGHPTGWYWESSWTSLFSQPEVGFDKGNGLGLWISDNQDRDNIFHEFRFPKNDTGYQIYFAGTDIPNTHFPVVSLPRTDNHKFIFDGLGSSGSDFNLSAEARQSGSLVLVGNPFMSHLDFELFYSKNSGKIKPEYKILNRNNNDYLYYVQGQPSSLTQYIAPMQSFIVESLVPFSELTVNGTMTRVVPGSSLRRYLSPESSSTATTPTGFYLPVTVLQDGFSGHCYIGFSNRGDGFYSGIEDVLGMFSSNDDYVRPVSIYSLSDDSKKLHLNNLPLSRLSGGLIPLGIRTPSRGSVTINVGNLSSLPSGVKAWIYDSLTDCEYDLSVQSMYRFEDPVLDSEYFSDGRFFLCFESSQSGIDASDSTQGSVVHLSKGVLSATSTSVITGLDVYDMQGRMLHCYQPYSFSFVGNIGAESFYFIRLQTHSGVEVFKLLNN